MQFHGEPLPPSPAAEIDPDAGPETPAEAEEAAQGQTIGPDNFRSIFGEPQDEGDLYQGVAADEWRTRQINTRNLLAKLAKRMAKAYAWDDGEGEFNTAIPAGYTYLAQFAAHDIVHSATPFNGIGGKPAARRNLRSERLILDTIYGGGPLVRPAAYAFANSASDSRVLLRLGRIKRKNCEAKDGPFRDIPRTASCPLLNDATKSDGLRETLLADPRNDDNFFVSQLTTIFHMLHNLLYRQIVASEQLEGGKRFRSDHSRFLMTRRLAALVYRRVLRKDLLGRLLNKDIFELYDNRPSGFSFIDTSDDPRLPLEFSHAAYRVGHVMVRERYKVNDDLTGLTSKDGDMLVGHALDATSARHPGRFPLLHNWLIRWSNFFPIKGFESGTTPQPSRRIGPSVVYPLADPGGSRFGDEERIRLDNEDGLGTGLIYRDLVRGAEAGIRSVCSIKKHLGRKLPPSIWKAYLQQSEAQMTRANLQNWLNDGGIAFENNEVNQLYVDPPLFFYVLYESALMEQGKRVGIVGSTIIAEVFFAALEESKDYIDENADVNFWATRVFDQGIPDEMGGIITFLVEKGIADHQSDYPLID